MSISVYQQPDHSDWEFGPVSGPLCGALGALALALGHGFVDFPLWLPVGVAAVASAVAVLVGWLRGTAWSTVAYRAACWLAGGGWVLWPAVYGWSWWNGAALFTVALVAGMLATTLAPERPRPAGGGFGLSLAMALPRSTEQEWVERINRHARISDPGVTRVQVERWPAHGFTLTGSMPAESGHRWTEIRDAADNIGSAADLPVGCPVVGEPGDTQSGWRLHVATSAEGLLADIPFPDDLSVRSIVDDFPIGHLLDTRPFMLNCYQNATVIVGERGGGKTVLLHNITGNVALTDDCVILFADLNGGSVAAPWVYAWANGQADRCRIEAVAIDADQALDLADWLEAVAKDRKSRYQHLLIANNTDVLPPGIVPELLVIVDEGGELQGTEATRKAQRAAEKFRAVQRIGRAMLINVVMTFQRGTSDYVPSQVKANAKNKIVLPVQDDAEIAYVYDWHNGLKAADLVTAGCMFVRCSTRDVPRQIKGYKMLPADIIRIAVATADRGPAVDAPAVRLGGNWWATRWTNPTTAAWLARLRGEDVDAPPTAGGDDRGSTPSDPFNLPDVDALISDAEQTAERLKTATAAPARPAEPAAKPAEPVEDLPEWAREALAGLDSIVVAEPDRPRRDGGDQVDAGGPLGEASTADLFDLTVMGRNLPPGKRLALLTIANAHPAEVKTGDVIAAVGGAGINVTRQTVSDWLKELRDAGLIFSPRQGYWQLGNGQAAA